MLGKCKDWYTNLVTGICWWTSRGTINHFLNHRWDWYATPALAYAAEPLTVCQQPLLDLAVTQYYADHSQCMLHYKLSLCAQLFSVLPSTSGSSLQWKGFYKPTVHILLSTKQHQTANTYCQPLTRLVSILEPISCIRHLTSSRQRYSPFGQFPLFLGFCWRRRNSVADFLLHVPLAVYSPTVYSPMREWSWSWETTSCFVLILLLFLLYYLCIYIFWIMNFCNNKTETHCHCTLCIVLCSRIPLKTAGNPVFVCLFVCCFFPRWHHFLHIFVVVRINNNGIIAISIEKKMWTVKFITNFSFLVKWNNMNEESWRESVAQNEQKCNRIHNLDDFCGFMVV